MNNNTYIELLKQYQTGTISEADRHMLERAALDAPFLFDAMEGYGVYGSSIDAENINTLKESKTNKSGKIRWLNIRNLSVAASLFALLAITFLMKNQLTESPSKNESTVVARDDSGEETVPMAQTWSDEGDTEKAMQLESNKESVNEDTVEETKEDEKENEAVLATKKNDANSTVAEIEEVIPETQLPAPLKTTSKDINPEYEELSNAQKANEEKEATIIGGKTKSDMEMNYVPKSKEKVAPKKRYSRSEEDAITYTETDGNGDYILGKVLDTDGNYLIGASVNIENTDLGTVTDLDGNFKLPKYENGHQMIANYTGYVTQKVVLGNIDFYEIVMPVSDNQLSEIVVTRPKEVDKNKAFPAMGMEDFEVYVSKNKEYPLEVFGTTKSGTFKVSFNVNSDGSLSHFLDEGKNCDECFKEAVKLLKGSGKWETKPAGQLYRTSYLFEF